MLNAESDHLRGHCLKLSKPKAKKSLRLNSFSLQTINVWNNLQEEVVTSKKVEHFKSHRCYDGHNAMTIARWPSASEAKN